MWEPAGGRSLGRRRGPCQRNFQSLPGQRCQPQRCHLLSPGGSDDREVGMHTKSDMEIDSQGYIKLFAPLGGGACPWPLP